VILANRNEAVIPAPAEKVWDILINLDPFSAWNPLLYQASGIVAVGETVVVYAKATSKQYFIKFQDQLHYFGEMIYF
jgi:hypothetical protein